MPLKILVVEDHENTRKSIVYGLKTFGDFSFISEAENGLQAIEMTKKNQPDLVLMDIIMPIKNGIEATKEIKKLYPDIKIIMLTSVHDRENVIEAFSSEINAYCMKSIKISELLNVIKMVLGGTVWIAPEIASYVLDFIKIKRNSDKTETQDDFGLTEREKEILSLLAAGLSNKDIAEKLFLSLHTVKNHVKSIIQKLSVKDRTQAAILALKEKLI